VAGTKVIKSQFRIQTKLYICVSCPVSTS